MKIVVSAQGGKNGGWFSRHEGNGGNIALAQLRQRYVYMVVD